LALHPTVKPVAMVADAILDCSGRGEVVLDGVEPPGGRSARPYSLRGAKRASWALSAVRNFCRICSNNPNANSPYATLAVT
jgi:hypothetical protein